MAAEVIEIAPETAAEEAAVKTNSRKREITAVVASTTLTVLLGLAATGAIERIGKIVKNKIAPETDPEKTETE